MQINLYPWNLYILYAMAFVLFLFLILTLVKMVKSLKEMAAIAPALAEMEKKLEVYEKKEAAASDALSSGIQFVKSSITIIVALNLLKKSYDKQEEKGIRGFNKAAADLITQNSEEGKLLRTIQKSI